ncbi:hypothetical protein [Sphingobium sp. DC-2]|uniref:hypothetical protein n=1 Tax=Sphingobium sp. DC-2 TaxID=1303256 RepID=UPI0012DD5DD0|nr:hypothetical protein [Sphingobium sp. DC-2]
MPGSFRPPITQAELDALPATLFIRSRSWLYDVRPGDVRLELRILSGLEEVVAVASPRLGPGDVGCIIGFEADEGHEAMRPDEKMISLADQLLRGHRQDGL